jgi:hypothetical protein
MRLTVQAIAQMKKASELFERENDREIIKEAQIAFREKRRRIADIRDAKRRIYNGPIGAKRALGPV